MSKKTLQITDDRLTNDNLAEAFGVLENAMKQDTAELDRITNDIRVLQSRLKKLNFQGVVNGGFITIDEEEVLGFDFAKKQLYYKGAQDLESRPLLGASAKIRKRIHSLHLSTLVLHLRDEFEKRMEESEC